VFHHLTQASSSCTNASKVSAGGIGIDRLAVGQALGVRVPGQARHEHPLRGAVDRLDAALATGLAARTRAAWSAFLGRLKAGTGRRPPPSGRRFGRPGMGGDRAFRIWEEGELVALVVLMFDLLGDRLLRSAASEGGRCAVLWAVSHRRGWRVQDIELDLECPPAAPGHSWVGARPGIPVPGLVGG
jgi:hypothetical protein